MGPPQALLAWFDRHRRELPWREDTNPYRVWVSEIMLQQTRVETVIPYYQAFLARFPTVEVLAAAELDEVLARWSGLGYYRRARQLHACAREVVARGGFPGTASGLEELPGIGGYTAAAVASIAFGEPVGETPSVGLTDPAVHQDDLLGDHVPGGALLAEPI
ncbi:MAG TPA: A/G-specific adenine glycosylase, partial [Thermoanaerobaculia bacterium]|nr:A/G-specific adenine glycosylase [Thermoanaerobaculia bacterium]